MRRLIKFSFISGIGWICDFVSFIFFVKIFEISGAAANIMSSYLGVTFVWLTSLKVVFGRKGDAHGRYLLAYWGFQLLSILAYSQMLQLVIGPLQEPALPALLRANPAVAGKIIITPFNLVTNFLFMKWLTRFMRQATPTSS